MREDKKALEDAVNYLVDDTFADTYLLKEILMENIKNSLSLWGELDEAICAGSDSPEQESKLNAMSDLIIDEVMYKLNERVIIKLK